MCVFLMFNEVPVCFGFEFQTEEGSGYCCEMSTVVLRRTYHFADWIWDIVYCEFFDLCSGLFVE